LTTIESSDAAGSDGDEEQGHKRIPERKQVTQRLSGRDSVADDHARKKRAQCQR
jgi:hypothetical protein